MRLSRAWLAVAAWLPVFAADRSDAVLKAMRDELEHSKALAASNLGKPYFISYDVEDGEAFAASASLGGLLNSTETMFRVPRVQVRVGDYQFDNTNYVGSGASFGGRYDVERFPVESVYPVLRRYLWLVTDQAYKSAVESLARKRAALKNVSAPETLADFGHAEPGHLLQDIPDSKPDKAAWLARVKELSAIFADYPLVLNSNVEVEAVKTVRRLMNSEGTEVRSADEVLALHARAVGQAPDGMRLHDAVSIHRLNIVRGPDAEDIRREVRQIAENIAALTKAPVGEIYNGPVVFEGVAAAQLFAELLGKNLALTRRPVTDPGRPVNIAASELDGRKGSRILPEWMDVVDDPTQQELNGRRLFGSYWIDFEGVAAKRLVLVEKGVLKNFLLTRQPVTGFNESNGRARLPGPFGASTAGISNLLVRASQTVPIADLKKQLIEVSKTRSQPYGMLVRKLDFPSSASVAELRRLMAAGANEGGGNLFSPPILIYKVYPDGKEELVRGLRFHDLNVRALRDIRAAGDDTVILDYLNNGAPLALLGAGNYAAETSVVAPSVLLDDVEVRKVDDVLPKPPVVPPPLATGK